MNELLNVNNLVTRFRTDSGVIKAVNDVSFSIATKETLGLVGESGCGKSVTSLSIMRLIQDPPGKIMSGSVIFKGRNLLDLSEKEMRSVRGREISMIFQEPMTSLNPVFSIGDQIAEVIMLHEKLNRKAALSKAADMMNAVAIPDPVKRLNEYPHHLSGGMRQRVMIAMALACRPSLLIADEPTTALDVTIQAQILDLLRSLKDLYHLSMLLITHSLGIVAETADNVAVMYAGRIVEQSTAGKIFERPLHPYTQGLLRSIPRIDTTDQRGHGTRLETIKGSVPDLANLPPGCSFAPRCPSVSERCKEESGMTIREPEPGHFVRCVIYD